MKKINKLLLAATAVSLISCGSGVTSSITQSNGNESSIQSNLKDWKDGEIKMMEELLGEAIPFIKLADGYTVETLVDDKDGSKYIYILSKDDEDISETYRKKIEFEDYVENNINNNNGYTSYVYSKKVVGHDIVIQFGYFQGNGEHPAGFEIFAWISIPEDTSIDYELIKDWSEEEKALQMEHYGELIPLAPLSAEHKCTLSFETFQEYTNVPNIVFVDPIAKRDALNQYYDEMLAMSDKWTLDLEFAQKNYAVFTKKADNKNGYIYLNMRLESTGLIIDSWIVAEEEPALITDWREETKTALKDLTMEDINLPVAPLSEGYIQEVYEYNEFSDIIDIFDPRPVSDFAEQYMPLLIEAGFVENEFYFERTGYHVFERSLVAMEAFNLCVKFGKGPLGLGFQIYKQEKLGGFGFVEYFPTEYIKNFLDNNRCRYTKFPEFPSELDGEYMFGTEDALIRIDMSEYMEKHNVSRLVGAPPGYVGYEEGGQLTEAVRRKPYSVILFDEIEKAHPDVFNIMLQIFDDGRLTDSKGRTVDFKNTVIIMTSNIGSDIILEDSLNAALEQGSFEETKEKVNALMREHFKPEFLNRVDETIFFKALNMQQLSKIVDIQMEHLRSLLSERQITFTITDDAKEFLATRGFNPIYGARPLKRVIRQMVENPLSKEILAQKFIDGDNINIDVQNDEIQFMKS